MGAAALHGDGWSPLLRAKADRSLCSSPQPSPPSPGTLGAAVGQPTVTARQGRQDRGWGLLPAAPGPRDATASQGGDPVQDMWGLRPQT